MSKKFKGILLKESLADEDVLSRLEITKTEEWAVANASPDQSNIWHALYFEGPDKQAKDIATELSQSLKDGPWYTNFSTAIGQVYIIFPNRVFTYKSGNQAKHDEAVNYGRSIAIPDSQLDWSE